MIHKLYSKIRNTFRRNRDVWNSGLQDEIDWWEEWLQTEEGAEWLAVVLNPECKIQDRRLIDVMESMSIPRIQMLEFGSGPISHVGYKHKSIDIDLICVDALAEHYGALLARLKINPLIKVLKLTGEDKKTYKILKNKSFDIIYASNCLDHCYNPILTISNLAGFLKNDGILFLRHYRNEAKIGNYHGLHQWNVDMEDNKTIISNSTKRVVIGDYFNAFNEESCILDEPGSHGVFDHTEWVVSTFRKIK